MSLLNFVDKFSFKQILSIAIILALLFAIPTTVWLVRQQTRLYSSAHRSNLPPEYEYIEEPFGQASENPPIIYKINPFLGKVDDIVIITGIDFGQNPRNRAIYFGEMKAHEQDILKWHNDVIEVMVPEGAVSGQVTVMEVDKQDTYTYPFIVYSGATKTRIYWQGNNLMVNNGQIVKKAVAVTGDGEVIEGQVSLLEPDGVLLPGLPNKSVSSLALYDDTGNLVPFYVNPIDFGF